MGVLGGPRPHLHIAPTCVPLDGDDQRQAMFHLNNVFHFDNCRDVRYEVMGFARQVEESHVTNQVEESHITNKDWNSIIVPKYGLRPLSCFGAPPKSKTHWLDVW